MRRKSLLLLALALGCGLVASLGINEALSTRPQPVAAQEVPTVPILVAATEIPSHTLVERSMVEFRDWDADDLPRDYISDPAQLEGLMTRQTIFPGEPIVTAKLGRPSDFYASDRIPEGMRAVTVEVNATTGVSGWIAPGDRVDVIWTSRTSGPDSSSALLLESVQVWAVDDEIDASTGGINPVIAKNVALLLTPEQAITVVHAQQRGELTLVLRAPRDEQATGALTVDDSVLRVLHSSNSGAVLGAWNHETPPPSDPQTPAPRPSNVAPPADIWQIEVWQGPQMQLNQFTSDGRRHGPRPESDASQPDGNNGGDSEVSGDESAAPDEWGEELRE